ncbi:hypothetical protein [Streptomyces sp. B4I13]|nr:hypothetical protein [Streptomyces sp. B4I13]
MDSSAVTALAPKALKDQGAGPSGPSPPVSSAQLRTADDSSDVPA